MGGFALVYKEEVVEGGGGGGGWYNTSLFFLFWLVRLVLVSTWLGWIGSYLEHSTFSFLGVHMEYTVFCRDVAGFEVLGW